MSHPDKRETERLLKQAGFTCRQAKKLLSGNWALIVGEEAAAEEEMLELVEQLNKQLKEKLSNNN